MPAPGSVTFTAEQFPQLLAAITEAARAAQSAPVAPAVTEQTAAAEAAELRGLDQQQLGERLVRRLTETWGMRSPGWTAGRPAPVTESAAQPSALAAAAQSLPISQTSMTLSEAMVAAHDLHSPLWTRPAGIQGVRTIFNS